MSLSDHLSRSLMCSAAEIETRQSLLQMKQHDAYAVLASACLPPLFLGKHDSDPRLADAESRHRMGDLRTNAFARWISAYAGLVQFLPQVLFMMFAGHITDRHNRKRVFMAALACNALPPLGLAINSALGRLDLCSLRLSLSYGTARARSSCLPARRFFPASFHWRFSAARCHGIRADSKFLRWRDPAIGGLLIGLPFRVPLSSMRSTP